MNNKSEVIFQEFKKDINSTHSLADLEILRQKYLGAKGSIKLLSRELKESAAEERKNLGPVIQKIQRESLNLFESKKKYLSERQFDKDLESQSEKLDFRLIKVGHLHPITRTIREMNDFFTCIGFSIMDGPEIETDEFCFKRLNVPKDHPARDMQDTIYIQKPNYLLRTQTSSIEARVLASFKPPFKIVSPGRVYRNEKANKSNHFIFHHYQGVVVLKSATLKDLFGVFTMLFKKMYGPKVVVRYRNKYYPEVAPGVGPDMQCFNCHGKGCSLCKGIGWIEMGGAGIIHPNVMKMANLDTKKWTGFAFGLGLDRWVMAKYNIIDIRTLLGGNLGYKYYESEGISNMAYEDII